MDAPKKKKGRPSAFNPSLGNGVKGDFRYPEAVTNLLRENPVKRLLNWMVMDHSFKEGIISLVPEHDPPEPKNPPDSE